VEECTTYCRICAAACGLLVTLADDRVVQVRGDDTHPVSRGYTCTKGRALGTWHHRSDRLDAPRVDGAAAGWDATVTDLAARLDAVRAAAGPDAVALYLATGLAYDAAGQIAAAQFLPAIGSSSFVTAVTVDNAPVLVAADLVSGQPMLNPVWDPTAPGLTLLVGTNPVVSHGYGTALPDPIRYLREYRARGGRVWVVDPRASETARAADVHLAVQPGGDVELLAALARAVLEDGADETELTRYCRADAIERLRAALDPFSPARAAAATGLPVARVEALITEVLGAPGRLAIHCGTGLTMARDGVVAEWLRWVLLILTGSLDRAGGMQFHRGALSRWRRPVPAVSEPGPEPTAPARPELPRVLGQLAAVALVDAIEAGTVRALILTGGNPLTAFPEPDRVRAALERLDVLAVLDVVESELTALATHVLAATGQLERADITLAEATALRSGLQATRAVVAPGAQRRPAWWILGRVARELGADLFGGIDPDLLSDELILRGVLGHSPVDADALFAAGAHGVAVESEPGWVHDTLLPPDGWNIAPPELIARLRTRRSPTEPPPLVLIPRRAGAWSNSIAYGPGPGPGEVRLHPGTAAAYGVADDDRVELRTDHGALTAPVRLDATLPPGVVTCTHGDPLASPGALTSGDAGVDPLTAMPRASGVTVTLRQIVPSA